MRNCLLVLMLLVTATGSKAQSFSEDQVSKALREALELASARTTEQLGAKDGYLGNELVKILLPEEVQEAAEFVRRRGGKVGAGLVDDVIEKMNRAAETAVASPETKQILISAVKGLTLKDVLQILKGDSVAATRYLQGQTEGQLLALLTPVINQKIDEVGLQKSWKDFADTYNRFSFFTRNRKQLPTDLSAYVAHRTLHGLFVVLGQQEAQIRKDPVGKAEGLVRDIFNSVLPGKKDG